MAMYEIIKNFNKQFEFKPTVSNVDILSYPIEKIIVLGMGGSHLSADLLKIWKPSLNLFVHSDYGLPDISNSVLQNSLIIVSSYSGNTEEVIDGYYHAQKKGLTIAVVASGGLLLKEAKKSNIPYVEIPDTGIQPRLALGFSFRALLALLREDAALERTNALVGLNPLDFEDLGRILARKLFGYVPIVYSSLPNYPIAYNWKIKLNETSKIPAFCNVVPELNHNEMTGFDRGGRTKTLSDKFYFVFLKDIDDNPRVAKRMEVLEKMYRERELSFETINLSGKDIFHKIFSSLFIADWTSFYLAQEYGVDPEQVPMVEEFKTLLQK